MIKDIMKDPLFLRCKYNQKDKRSAVFLDEKAATIDRSVKKRKNMDIIVYLR